jgi:hypothetical protein
MTTSKAGIKLSRADTLTTLKFLSRAIPKGQLEQDELYAVIAKLERQLK